MNYNNDCNKVARMFGVYIDKEMSTVFIIWEKKINMLPKINLKKNVIEIKEEILIKKISFIHVLTTLCQWW